MPQANNNAPANLGAPRPLSARRQLLAEAIATGMTRKQAAAHCGLSTKATDNALKDPRMKALIEEKIGEITKQMRGKLRSVGNLAVLTLAKVAGDSEAPPAARVSAATAILDRIGVSKTSVVEVVSDDRGMSVEERLDRLAARLGSALSSIPDAEDAPDEEPDDDADDDDAEG